MLALAALHLGDVADVAIVTFLLWMLIVWLRRTRGRFALIGLGIVFALYLVAQQLGLQLTVWLFQGFFAAVALVMIVVFQDDLRRLFERIAVTGLRRRRPRPGPDAVESVARAVSALAEARTGALVVIPGRDLLDRYLEGGVFLRGRVSAPLLESLFDTHSAGHDGAVVLEGNEVARFAVHLPLSVDNENLGRGGTRHAAALGLTERTDALCIVVSEERGTLSVARNGRLDEVDAPALVQELRRYVHDSNPMPREAGFSRWLRGMPSHWPEGLAATAIAVWMWAVLVDAEADVEMAFAVPVHVANLSPGYMLESIEPQEVWITLSGSRREVNRANPANVQVRIDAEPVGAGSHSFEISDESVEHPSDVDVVAVAPGWVEVQVRVAEDAG
ncbi:MAG: DNA integrity scanning protein DisA nucleotide-binding domain protein [Myxococcales bacterium]|nr:DNA integrity scanning protein DisA nucleotide-binding domain protein [Myxococcales bacterium]